MYRIVREFNELTGRAVYVIERKKKWLWMVSWTTDLGLDIDQLGPIGAPSLQGAKIKLDRIISNKGKMIKREVASSQTNII